MSNMKGNISYGLVKAELQPIGHAFAEGGKLIDSDELLCPFCNKAKCWASSPPPTDDREPLKRSQCPFGVFLVELGKEWGVEPGKAAKIMFSMKAYVDLGSTSKTGLHVVNRYCGAVFDRLQADKKSAAESRPAGSEEDYWTVEFNAVGKVKNPRPKKPKDATEVQTQ